MEFGLHGLPPRHNLSYNGLTCVSTTTHGEANYNTDAWIGSSVSSILQSIRSANSEPNRSVCDVYQTLLKCLVVFVMRADQVLLLHRPTCQF